jgi:cytochrome c oxidase subunit 2
MDIEHQSALHPAPGSAAALIHELSLALYFGGALIFLLVMTLLLRAVFSGERAVNTRRWVVGGGIVFPTTVLGALLVYSLAVGSTLATFNTEGPLRFLLDCISRGARALSPPAAPGAMRIDVIARQWWWEVRYLNTDEAPQVTLANELHLPQGRAIEVFLTTGDVIHSFWVPSLAGKVDMIPGRRTRIVLQSDDIGVHRGQCAEYCGGQHAWMALHVVVERETEFARWLAGQARDANAPHDAFLQSGHDAFMVGGCGGCHTVRGTAAKGESGPDLTHVGSRHALAAGMLENHVGNMAGWIAAAQQLKPGTPMPSAQYSGRDLRAVSAWLASLQ